MNENLTGMRRVSHPSHGDGGGTGRWIQLSARALVLLWAGFCSIAVIADVMTTTPDAGALERAVMIAFGVAALAAFVAVAWKWEVAGGALFVLIGLFLFVATIAIASGGSLSGPGLLVSLVVITLPPLVAGALFLFRAGSGRLR